jgi:NAD(P)-dependent dehydrogenase (short-subunit alcohol dehydrogenase family)
MPVTEQRVAVVTGGGTGIGFATACALAEAGLAVMIGGRRDSVLREAADSIRTSVAGARIAHLSVDVALAEDCSRLVEETVSEFGEVDVLVAAAAIYEPVPFLELSAEAWDRTLDIALRGSALCSVAAARRMRDRGGRIVLVSSLNARVSEPESAHYSAAKAGISSLARSMALDLADYGIAVNAVAPGWVRTPMTLEFLQQSTTEMLRRVNPLARAGEPEEIASFIRYLAIEAPPFLTGATLFIDGGQTAVAPMP